MVLAIIKVVVAVIVVAVPIVVDAVHDNHPLLLDPFPRAERTDAPQRNGRPRAVARMARDVAVADTWRRRMVVWRRTDMSMPCDGRPMCRVGRSGMICRAGRSGMMCRAGRAGPGCRPCGMRSRSPRRLGCPCRVSVAAMVAAGRTAPWRS